MTLFYPLDAYVDIPQDESQDFDAGPESAKGADFNRVEKNLKAVANDARAAIGKEGAASLAAAFDAIADPMTDGKIPISAHDFDIGLATLWSHANAPDGGRAWKFFGAGVESIRAPLTPLLRTTASKGLRLKGFEITWSVYDADITTDVSVTIVKRTFNGDGNIPSISTVPFTWDVAHDTADERKNHAGAGVPKHNTGVITLDAPFFLDGTAHYTLSVLVNDGGGGSGTVWLFGGFALTDIAMNDVG